MKVWGPKDDHHAGAATGPDREPAPR
jgi:hypothetical protein